MRKSHMNFAIDIGNTFCKVGKFENHKEVEVLNQLDLQDIISLIKQDKPSKSILSSVRNHHSDFLEEIKSSTKLLYLSHQTLVPVQNHYETPHTLGLDRLAGVVGAKTYFPDEPCLVVDLGTCITFDLIDAENNYWGGNIAPGMNMRLRAMHEFTAKLPMIEVQQNELSENILGRQTTQAMLNGVIQGIKFEIQGLYQELLEKYASLRLILSGGDATFFETKLKEPIFAVPFLNLIGLNTILEYNDL